jgi:hypothetical protein
MWLIYKRIARLHKSAPRDPLDSRWKGKLGIEAKA